jgi:integrase
MSGSILRRGERSWRIKYDLPNDGGPRKTVYATVKGTKRQAAAELIKRLAEVERGTAVDPSKVTVAGWLEQWITERTSLSPKTAERYGQLIRHQIAPHLGDVVLQRLRPADVAAWQAMLLRSGSVTGTPLSPRTASDARQLLRLAVADAARLELVSRNVCDAVLAPMRMRNRAEVEIVEADQVGDLLDKLGEGWLRTAAILALGTGMRRGELLALRWCDVDLDVGTVRVERSLEHANGAIRVKAPKTRAGTRTISLPAVAVGALREHRHHQLGLRLQLGLGRPGADDLVFTKLDGEAVMPNTFSGTWGRTLKRRGLPPIRFHALRHTHASALISGGLDVVSVSRRLGHSSPTVTLSVYAHKFEDKDGGAAAIAEAMFKR